MESAVAFAKAFADPSRLRILALLRKHELCVCELSDALELSQSTLSTHLAVLRDSGVVRTRKDGKWIYYALTPEFSDSTARFFEQFEDLKNHRRIRRDRERVARRLKIREGGRCTRGFDQLQTSRRARAA